MYLWLSPTIVPRRYIRELSRKVEQGQEVKVSSCGLAPIKGRRYRQTGREGYGEGRTVPSMHKETLQEADQPAPPVTAAEQSIA